MKNALMLAVLGLVVAQAMATYRVPLSKTHYKTIKLGKMMPVTEQAQKVGFDKCKTCIEFAGQALNELLNIILQGGVVGGCGELCNALASKTSPAIGTVCNILCDVVGVEEFIKIVQNADLDPIYYCELLTVCPVKDDGDAKFTSFTASPTSGPQGTFALAFAYSSVNGTGTGEIALEIDTVDGIPLGQTFLHEMADAGTYTGQFQVKAEPDPSCDPTQQPCEEWMPGNYTVKIALCNGECGSKHPHSTIYDETTTTFTITQ